MISESETHQENTPPGILPHCPRFLVTDRTRTNIKVFIAIIDSNLGIIPQLWHAYNDVFCSVMRVSHTRIQDPPNNEVSCRNSMQRINSIAIISGIHHTSTCCRSCGDSGNGSGKMLYTRLIHSCLSSVVEPGHPTSDEGEHYAGLMKAVQ